MKGSSGQAMVPASICPFPNSTLFNDSICRQQDRLNGVLYPAIGSLSLAVAPGCGMALDRTGMWVYQPACWLWELRALPYRQQTPFSDQPEPGHLLKLVPGLPCFLSTSLGFSLAAKRVQELNKTASWSFPYLWDPCGDQRSDPHSLHTDPEALHLQSYDTLSQLLINCVSVH